MKLAYGEFEVDVAILNGWTRLDVYSPEGKFLSCEHTIKFVSLDEPPVARTTTLPECDEATIVEPA